MVSSLRINNKNELAIPAHISWQAKVAGSKPVIFLGKNEMIFKALAFYR
jgi:hypothetical protein